MSSPSAINRFKGTDWEECDEFILAVRAAAWKEGKLRDLAWMADFASLHFCQKALRWHSRLPQDVREDWSKLEIALLERWTLPDDDDKPPVEPTPAAALSLHVNDRADRALQGVLKAVLHGSKTNYYFKIREDGLGGVTTDLNEALRIRCISWTNTTILQRIDGSRHSWLGINWRSSNPNLRNGSIEYGYLVLVDSISLKTSWGADAYLSKLAPCTISADGEVILFWENNDGSKITISIFFSDSNPGAAYLAADPDDYAKRNPDEIKAKFFIEPID